jgi:molybdate transport system substrate-binding protein
MKSRLSVFVGILVVVLAACSGGSASPSASIALAAGAHIELTVFGAASLKKALDQVKPAHEAANPGTTLTIATDSSSALEAKIEQGAAPDVFLSADTANPKKLVDAGLADGVPVDFAANELTIIVPADNPAKITSAKDLAKDEVKIIAAGDEVPITKYAKQLVENLAKEADYPADYEAAYDKNVATKEDNVKNIVGKIELGEGDAGIVYVTDAKASDKVKTIDVPDESNVPATYAGVVVGGSKNPAAAKAFLDWLAGPQGQAIFGGLGFVPPS